MEKSFVQVLKRLYRERFVLDKTRNKVAVDLSGFKELQVLKKDGIVILPDFYSREFCGRVMEAIDRFLHANAHLDREISEQVKQAEFKRGVPMSDGTKYWVDKEFSDKRINGAEKISSLIEEFGAHQFFLDYGRALLGFDIKLNYVMANKVVFSERNLGSGGGWHRDNNYQHGFKALLYLNDVNEENGPFEYMKGTFSLKNHLVDFPYPDKYQFTDEEVDAFIKKRPELYTCVTAKAGSVVIFNTNGIHRGKPLRKGVRYAITNYYF